MSKKVRISCTLTKEDVDILNELADRQGINTTDALRRALRAHRQVLNALARRDSATFHKKP